ncbi:hypothetical protein [Salegentibacter salarius]|uniref:Uncharacterized protein n=1 Tax=Salegentibacter salarius TaxID=435906 RepID=A0A2N0TR93_9FLAO|nr:hypothetical protein [Salegentibacter salarius]OEY71914.1 hypothetical protein BHS39_14955 [Salegentibacter salarius]PKD17262.1 hypothetical protein APR40_14925 [Salegentibacter salarius]SLK06113.1 hypothetical protein SAMN05660445_03073 [Salegentibacter salarius]
METVELRNKPELKITINQNGFQILDSADPVNNGHYSFFKLNHVEFHPAQTDWLVSIVSVVVDLITGGGNSGKFKNKPNLQFKVASQSFKVYLIDADLDKAKAITDLLNKKSLHTTTYKNNA